jgi:hypothetical protein
VDLEHVAIGGAGEGGKIGRVQPRRQRGERERDGGDGGAEGDEPLAVAGEFRGGGVEIDVEFGDADAVGGGFGQEFAGED